MQLPLLIAAVACVVGYLILRELYLRERIGTVPALLVVFAFLLAAPILAMFSVASQDGVPLFILAIAVAGSALATWGTYMTKVLMDRKQRRHDR